MHILINGWLPKDGILHNSDIIVEINKFFFFNKLHAFQSQYLLDSEGQYIDLMNNPYDINDAGRCSIMNSFDRAKTSSKVECLI